MTRIRRDKDWSTATTLDELRGLFRKKPESTDFSLLLGSSDVKDVPIKRSLDSPEASPSPEKMKKTTSGPDDDEPSTSFAAFKCKIKEEPPDVPEGSSRGQKRDKHDGSPDGIADVRSARKRLKVEHGIKKETEDPSLAIVKKKRKKKKDDEKEEEKESDLVVRKTKKQEDRNVNQLVGGVSESFSAETTVFDSDAENDVSNNYIVIACRFISGPPAYPLPRDSFQGTDAVVLKDVRASLAPGFDDNGSRDARKLLRTYPFLSFFFPSLFYEMIIHAWLYSNYARKSHYLPRSPF